jgi:hypothetical protein
MTSSKPQEGNGIVNAKDGISMLAVAPVLYVGGATLANYLTTPGGTFEKLLNGILNTTSFVATAGSTSTMAANRVIPALSALYLFATYTLSSVSSAAAISSAFKEGRNNKCMTC